jgi:hypothetical protein
MRIAAIAALGIAFTVTAAAPAGAEKAPPPPLVFSEKLSQRVVKVDDFLDVATTVKMKATFTVPYDVGALGEPTVDTVLSVILGDFAFEDGIDDAFKFVPGKSAKWVRRDDFTGKVVETVTATWKGGLLKVTVRTNGEDSAYASLYEFEEDLLIEEEAIEGMLAFGATTFDVAGSYGGTADTTPVARGDEEFSLSMVSLAGTGEATEEPDLEDPWIEISAPFDGEEFAAMEEITMEFVVTDDRSIHSVSVQVDGGAFQIVPFTVVPDPETGGVRADVSYTLASTGGSGSYVLTVRAYDSAFNEASATVNVDIVPVE